MAQKEKRGFLRIDDVTSVTYSKTTAPKIKEKEAKTLDIGGGGIRLISSEDLPLGTRLNLSFTLPIITSPISCEGEVIWREEIEEGTEKKFALGVCFTEISEKDRIVIVHYVFTQHYKLEKTEELAVDIEDLTKRYDGLVAINKVSLKIKPGEVFALLGPNGAGKTTLTRILATLLSPTYGKIKIFGYELNKKRYDIRKIIGYMPQSAVLYEDLTARENLQFFGQAHHLKGQYLEESIEEVLAFVELSKRADSLVHTFSGGMKQRLSLACALLHHPKILLLDEPTAGVDLRLRKSFWEYFHKLSETGVTIFVTTHQMDEVEYCQRCAFMQTGKIIIDDTPKNIKKLGKGEIIVTLSENEKRNFIIENYEEELPRILKDLPKEEISRIEIEKAGLEEILREMIKGEEMRD